MKQKFYSLFLAALLGMWGMQMEAQNLTTTEIDGVTYYEIGTAEDLVAFATLVKGDAENEIEAQPNSNAVLTADIDLTIINETTGVWETPIGTTGRAFTGIFDGQGHKITNFDGESFGRYGLFGNIKDATVQNFSIAGRLTAYSENGEAAHGAGAIGWAESSHIFNVHSALEIEVVEANVHHVGGVVGSANYNNFIKGCSFSGTLKEEGGNTDCFGGVAGYTASDTIMYCANYGTISFSAAGAYAGGIAGYLNNSDGCIIGCLNIGSVIFNEPDGVPSYGGAIIGRLRGNTASKLQNNVWLEGSGYAGTGENSVPTTLCVTPEQLASGEICYYLNGDQSVIGWYQNLDGTDAQPVLDATHAQVYMNGRLHCNGDVYEGAVYSNENTGIQQDEHNFVDGICSHCGFFNESYLTPNADGFYEIATAGQLAWFEQKVNKGELEANAILTADIDFADLMSEDADPEETEIDWTPIGDWGATRGTSSAGYKGHFDGQGHTIKNLNATSKQNYFGLFGVISTGALIENFDIYGTYNTTFQYAGGVAAYARDSYPTIRDIHSFVNINNTCAGGRQGGILGGVLTTVDKTIIENCTYSGTLDGNDAGGSGNYGGIVGYVNNNGATVADITNCLFDGNVVNNNAAPGGCTFGGFVGYSNGGVVTIKNSLSIGHVESAVWGQFFGAVKSTKSSLPNSYYIGEILNGSASTVTLEATETNTDELASGEICWKLNEETFIDATWRQTLNEENYPKPYGIGAIVYQTPTGYDCISEDNPESFSTFIKSIIANEEEFLENLVAYQVLIDEYKETIKSWENIDNYEDFIAAYQASTELKEAVKQSAAAYAKYIENCEYASNYLTENNIEGQWSDFLKTYLQENIEPGANYPNGSYAYIMENCNLDDEAIAAEIEFVNLMMENAIAGGVKPGTEITRLLANSNFENGFDGWTTEAEGITLAHGGTEAMPILRGLGNGTFNVAQTHTDLTNGIYMMTLNGMFRAGDDVTNTFYAGQLYLNGTANYVMSPGEDVVLEENAEPGVNCLGEGSDKQYELDGTIGWVPNGMGGCSVAYGAGRYLNYCATEVTDGTLTVGVRSLGTGLASDWLPFGNLHVYYLGTPEEASEKLSNVLKDFAARAKIIQNFLWDDYDGEYTKYPNMSIDLITRLSAACNEVPQANTGEAKMALINKFSDLFNQVHACRKAYIALCDAANKMQDYIDALDAAGLLAFTDYDEWSAEILNALDNYSNGDISAEEAMAIVEKFNSVNLVPIPISEDGVYQLATAEHARIFSVLVNSGNTTAKAVMTEDLDMSELGEDVSFEPIGSSSNPFTGEFDGQGHKITNFGQYIEEEGVGQYTLSLSGDAQGFIGYASGATIKNFSIEGAFEYNGGTGAGAVGWATGSTLSNIHSSLDIAVPVQSHHIGGVCGHLSENSKAINCSFSGTITVAESANTHDCIGGIGAYSNNGVSYINCANYGTIIYSLANAYAGGICGYVNNDSFTGVFNCLNVGTVKMANGTPTYGGAFVGRLRSHANSKFENNYMLESSAPNTSGENAITANTVKAEQLASGEVCYKLNGDQEEINWYQTLTEDIYPVLDPNHKVVFYNETDGYYNEGGSSKGDLNKDGKVDIADAVTVLNIMAAGEYKEEADINHDQKVDIADFVSILNIMAAQ